MSTDFTIIRVGVEAAPLFAAVHEECFDPSWPEADFARLLASSGVSGLIATQGDQPLGLSLIRSMAGDCEILTLGVMNAHRRQGVGRLLLQGSHDEARYRGAQRMILEVSVSNCAAVSLYLSAGYREIAQRQKYYRDGSAARILALDLV